LPACADLVAARRGAIVALANKEALVCAGRLLIDAIEIGGALLPSIRSTTRSSRCFEPAQRTPSTG
jgi:1-deoxy-D-xylulose-5-phosphate reductoisomerase